MKPRVLLLSTVHPATDPRIRLKIATSLMPLYEVICALPGVAEAKDGIRTIRLPVYRKLWKRILLSYPVVLWRCFRLRPAIVHIFVPELIPVAMLFHWTGSQVIYEVQENLFKKFSIKRYNNGAIFKATFRYFDKLARRNFRIVLTEDAYKQEYCNLAFPPTIIRNFASLSMFEQEPGRNTGGSRFLYSGVISLERCFDVLVKAVARLMQTHPDVMVDLYGPVRISRDEMKAIPGYDLVKSHLIFHGYTDLRKIIADNPGWIAGIALLRPVADYPDSYTTKLFEYMALNLPVITSDFELYKPIVRQPQSGFCIKPDDDQELAGYMRWLIEHPDEARRMGMTARRTVAAEYSWASEEKNLITLYKIVHRSGMPDDS